MNEQQKQAATQAMINWLEHPHELGRRPTAIECAGEFNLHDMKYYIFKYKKSLLGKWLLGVCGGYDSDELEHCGHVFSEMDDYDISTAKEKAVKMVEQIRTYWMEQAEKYQQKEYSEGGSQIIKHKPQDKQEWRQPAISSYAEEINSHFGDIFTDCEAVVFHEVVSDLVHIDVNVMKPTQTGGFHILYTTGMSDLPMTLPDHIAERTDLRYAELIMLLPDSWNPGKSFSISTEMPLQDSWAIDLIKYLARFPHEHKTWLCDGHTIPNGSNYEPYLKDSRMSCVVLLPSPIEALSNLITADGTTINFYSVLPITRAEAEFKLKRGMDALLDKFTKTKVPLIIDMYRKSAV